MRLQIELQLGIRGIRHNSHVSPGYTNVEKVYNILDKVLNLLEIVTPYAARGVQNECQVHRCLTN